MRDFIDEILTAIGTASLNDEEYEALTIESASYDKATYEAIAAVLNARESISTLSKRLVAYFFARGVEVSEVSQAKSNIYVGSVL